MATDSNFYPFCKGCGYNITIGEYCEHESRRFEEFVAEQGSLEQLDEAQLRQIREIRASWEFAREFLKDQWDEPLTNSRCSDRPCKDNKPPTVLEGWIDFEV